MALLQQCIAGAQYHDESENLYIDIPGPGCRFVEQVAHDNFVYGNQGHGKEQQARKIGKMLIDIIDDPEDIS